MTEIYNATPIQAFQTNLIVIVILVGLGLFSIPMLFRRQTSKLSRVAIGVAILGLMCAGLGVAALTAYQYTNGTQTLTAQLAQKQVVRGSDSNGNPVDYYHLFFGAKATFDVERSAYDKLTQGACYQVTFYPSTGILGLFGVSAPPSLQTGAIASIKQPSANQCR